MPRPVRIISHSRYVIDRAIPHGWKAGARYTNLRDVKHLTEVYFIDIDWKNYNFEQHLAATRKIRPKLTVARDVTDAKDLASILIEAHQLNQFAETVIVVPKDTQLAAQPRLGVPETFRLGYSIPTRYGGTEIPASKFAGDVHLLGGRPDVQRALADQMQVRSLDGNRFTLDAKFGDYFNGTAFRPHPKGGYENCLNESLRNIASLWEANNGEGQDS